MLVQIPPRQNRAKVITQFHDCLYLHYTLHMTLDETQQNVGGHWRLQLARKPSRYRGVGVVDQIFTLHQNSVIYSSHFLRLKIAFNRGVNWARRLLSVQTLVQYKLDL